MYGVAPMCQKLLGSGTAKPNEAGLWPQGAHGLIGEGNEQASDLALC